MDNNTPPELGFHVIAKPIGPICNLNCAYCYYLPKEVLFSRPDGWRMTDEILEAYVQQYIAAQPESVPVVEFAWQGGEPTLLGVEFFERALELQAKHSPPGKSCRNSIQTNGTLLDDRWCEFLKANDFLVGLSIDGPADLHDKYRRDKLNRPTFEQVIRGLQCMQKHDVQFNALTVVNRHNGSHPRRVYRFLKEIGVEFIQLIPIVERLENRVEGAKPQDMVSERSVRPRQFGKFMIELFEEWVRLDVGRIFVPIFDQALAAWMRLEPPLCIFRRQCGRALVIEHNGDLFSCDHFVDPDYKLGNISETPIVELVNLPQQVQFGLDKETKLPEYCLQCNVRFVCNGECPKNRFIKTPSGASGLNYLCEGYKMFFKHIGPYMSAMAEEVLNERPASNVMYRLNQTRQGAKHSWPDQPTRRNDPCPCGSGRKYKNCCMRT